MRTSSTLLDLLLETIIKSQACYEEQIPLDTKVSVAGVVTLTFVELIESTGVAITHGAAPYPAAPLYNLAVCQEQRGAHCQCCGGGSPSTIAGIQRELGKKEEGACFLWLERWAFRY
jgi:hypothetical protein